jgi:anti-sigma regulatory factor (Ser/Thr protein kinase)
MKKLTVEAKIDNLDQVTDFITRELEDADCSVKVQMQIELAVEEIFVNIASYAYAPGTGSALIKMSVGGEPTEAEITFIDRGVRYDPLAKEDPDITLDADQREIGGLGIFMVKQTMDDVKYEYRDGHNILTLKKNLKG